MSALDGCEAAFTVGLLAHFAWDFLLVGLGAALAALGYKFKFKRHCSTHHNHP